MLTVDGNPTCVFGIPWNKTQAKDGLQPLVKRSNLKDGGLMRKIDLVEATKKAFVLQMTCKDEEPKANIHKDKHVGSHRKRHLQAIKCTVFG